LCYLSDLATNITISLLWRSSYFPPCSITVQQKPNSRNILEFPRFEAPNSNLGNKKVWPKCNISVIHNCYVCIRKHPGTVVILPSITSTSLGPSSIRMKNNSHFSF
jgi:hypothetical protein